MIVDSDREKNRFQVWQVRHDKLIEMVAGCDFLTKSNTPNQLIEEQEKWGGREG